MSIHLGAAHHRRSIASRALLFALTIIPLLRPAAAPADVHFSFDGRSSDRILQLDFSLPARDRPPGAAELGAARLEVRLGQGQTLRPQEVSATRADPRRNVLLIDLATGTRLTLFLGPDGPHLRLQHTNLLT